MATEYADIVDPEVIEETIPDDYQDNAKLVVSGLVTREPEPLEGTQASFIKETLFEGDDEGQAIGINGEITLKDKSQTKYQIPVFWRADGCLMDDIEGEITPKRKRSIQLEASNAVQRKALQMQDTSCVYILEGCGMYLASVPENYLDTAAVQVTLSLLQSAKSQRNDEGAFDNGILLVRSLMYHRFCSLNLVQNDSNTLTDAKRTEVLQTGTLGVILGMNFLMTDKLAVAADGDYYSYLCEKSALRIKGTGAPKVDPIVRAERNFQDIIKFRFKLGGHINGMDWQGTASDLVTNAQLATAANWARAKTYAKNVPIVVMRSPVPTMA